MQPRLRWANACPCISDRTQVHYSIAKCGVFSLHVALRYDGAELPGSPFELTVSAGPASAVSTSLPAEALPLLGVVGLPPEVEPTSVTATSGTAARKTGGARAQSAEVGCTVVLQAEDKVGNLCREGNEKVEASCNDESIRCRTQDNGDGTYILSWHSATAGIFQVCQRVWPRADPRAR